MEGSTHDCFGLEVAVAARICGLRSRLMLAKSRLVEIFLSSCLFSTAEFFFSMRNPL